MVKTKVECYSRVVGYVRPVENWNDAKQAEFRDRHLFDAEHPGEIQKKLKVD